MLRGLMLILKKLIYTTTEIHKHTNIQHVQLVVLLMKSMTLKFSIKESRCRNWCWFRCLVPMSAMLSFDRM